MVLEPASWTWIHSVVYIIHRDRLRAQRSLQSQIQPSIWMKLWDRRWIQNPRSSNMMGYRLWIPRATWWFKSRKWPNWKWKFQIYLEDIQALKMNCERNIRHFSFKIRAYPNTWLLWNSVRAILCTMVASTSRIEPGVSRFAYRNQEDLPKSTSSFAKVLTQAFQIQTKWKKCS